MLRQIGIYKLKYLCSYIIIEHLFHHLFERSRLCGVSTHDRVQQMISLHWSDLKIYPPSCNTLWTSILESFSVLSNPILKFVSGLLLNSCFAFFVLSIFQVGWYPSSTTSDGVILYMSRSCDLAGKPLFVTISS